ncbi:MAG: polyribonucleotide nucleotidyltransferase [Tissierellia bacterium]|nr:polyribonucleotide nucleotidyltransferase [Tissierellia bacterium]
MIKSYTYDLQGKELKITVGKVAEQANGACLVQMGESIIMVTATASKKPREGIDFFPLSCDFEEKLYSVGKIPGGFIKREGRPSERAVLASRLIDRPLRPLFPEGYRNDVQVIATPLSVEPDSSLEAMAMIGSSVALSISDIPFMGPTGAVTIGYVDEQIVLLPDLDQRSRSKLNLTLAGTQEAIMMVEAGVEILPESIVLEAILTGHEEIKGICNFISEIQADIGKEKLAVELPASDPEMVQAVTNFAKDALATALKNPDKTSRQEDTDRVNEETLQHFEEIYPEEGKAVQGILDDLMKAEVRRMILEDGIRPDARKCDEIREISCEVGLLPRAHGAGLFNRGQTQVLSITSLGAPGDVQMLDGLVSDEKKYMHHYNFPPFSVGETRPLRSPGRREIGHGALAERALIPVLPDEEQFPYTIRVVSEVLSSNGSSSQGSVCGSSLSLMDAGVPLKGAVAGIAMGLIKDENSSNVAILSDIQGLEDHLGDMDFKVAGTKDGITAIQMDIKIAGIDRNILEEALEKARIGRMHILGKMNEVLSAPREQVSEYAPRIFTVKVHPEKIREIIGPGGKVINKIIDETGVKIDTFDDGTVVVTAENTTSGEKAVGMINDIVKEIEVGEVYTGKVTRIMNFGAFVEVLNGKEGLVHISQLAHERTNKVEDVLNIGDVVTVKVIEIDKQGRVNLSRKALLPKQNKSENPQK